MSWDWWNDNEVVKRQSRTVVYVDGHRLILSRIVTLVKRVLGSTRKEVFEAKFQDRIRVLEWAGYDVTVLKF